MGGHGFVLDVTVRVSSMYIACIGKVMVIIGM